MERTSPDGRIRVRISSHEMRMSHWVNQPRVVDEGSGEVLFDLWGADTSLWDGALTFPEPGVVELDLRHYGSGATCRVRIDADARTWRLLEGDDDPVVVQKLAVMLRRS